MSRALPLLVSLPLVACAPSHPAASAQELSAQRFADDAPEYVFADPDRVRKLASAFPAIDSIAEAMVRDHHIPGLALGVVVDGRLAHFKGAGVTDLETKAVPDADTVFRIGSITKSFTGLAVLALRDDGVLSLDDPLVRHLPEAAGLVYPTRDAPPITLRQLLTHTSGLPRLGDFDYTRADRELAEQDVTRSLARFPLDSAPGTRSVYSNLGFALLGLAVGRAAHEPLRAFLAKRLFAPLGMTSTSFDPSALPPGKLATGYQKNPVTGAITPASTWRLGASEGAGGIYSTARDMARYVAFQLDAYPPRNAPDTGPIRRSSVRESHENALRHMPLVVRLRDAPAKGERRIVARAAGYAYGWVNAESCDFAEEIWHNGSVDGFASAVVFLPGAGVGVVVLANLGVGGVDATPVAERALLALEATGGLSPRVRRAVLPPAFEPAMKRLLAVYNAWDLDAYKAMLSPERSAVPPEEERVELAGYKSFHGACGGWAPLEVASPRTARLAMQCERGTFEMGVSIDTKGLIVGFWGTSRDVPAPPAVARAADRIVGLVKAWDDGVYTKILGGNATKTKAEWQAFFDGLRAAHGACVTRGFVRTNDTQSFALSCDEGGDLTLTLKLDEKNEDAVASFAIAPVSTGACPTR